jgi:hypothetical protein
MKNTITLLLVLNLFFLSSQLTKAQSNPEATSSAETVRTEVQERIQNVINTKIKATEEELSNKLNSGSLYAYKGIITNIKDNVIGLDTTISPIQINVASSSSITKDGKAIKLDALALKTQIIAFGFRKGDDVLDAKRIVVDTTKPAGFTKETLVAKVVKYDSTSNSVTIMQEGKPVKFLIGKRIKTRTQELQPDKTIYAVILKDSDPKVAPYLANFL